MLPSDFALVRMRQEDLLNEAAADRLAAQVQQPGPSVRKRLAGWLYRLAAWLNSGVADARVGGTLVKMVTRRNGVEYWRPWPGGARH